MVLTEDTYYGLEASRAYMSVSQFKNFQKCEAAALAEIKGEYVPERGRALLLGSYVDEMLTGTVESVLFKGVHYEIIVEACSVDWIIHSTKAPEVGSVVGMTFTPQDIHIMHRDPEDAPAPQETARTPDDSADTK